MPRMTSDQWNARVLKIRDYVKGHGPTNYKVICVFLEISPTQASIWCGTCIHRFKDMRYEDGVLSMVEKAR